MGAILTFFAGPWGLVSKILIFAAILGGIWLHGRHNGVKAMEPKVEAAESAAQLWQKTAENRKTLIEAQNTAVDALRQAQATRVGIMEKKLATAIVEGQKWRDAAERRADILATMPLPENECQALAVLIDEARK